MAHAQSRSRNAHYAPMALAVIGAMGMTLTCSSADGAASESRTDLVMQVHAALSAKLEGGESVAFFVTMGAARLRASVVSCDDDGVAARVRGSQMRLSWDRMQPKDLLSLGSRVLEPGGATHLLRARVCLEAGLEDEAVAEFERMPAFGWEVPPDGAELIRKRADASRAVAAKGAAARSAAGGPGAVVVPGPAPGDLSQIANLSKSDAYTVTVRGGSGADKPCFVYMTPNYFPERFRRSQTAVSFTSFSFAGGPVTVTVKCRLAARSALIRPKRANIPTVVSGDTVRFTLDAPRKISLEVNDRAHPLLVFAEAPERLETNATHYFPPGSVTKVGTKKEIKAGESVYIAGGAVVEGTLLCTGHNNTFRGRGILSSGYISWDDWKADKSLCQITYPHWQTARSNDFSGLILLNTPGWCNYGQLVDSKVRDVKFIAWNGNSDAIHLGGDSVMEDCFFFINDDCLIANAGNSNVWRRCTIWRSPWGHPIISLLTKRQSHGYLWEDIDIFAEEGGGPVITLKNYKNWGKDGTLTDFTVRNVWVESPRRGPLLKVEASACSINNFRLENVFTETTLPNEGLIALPEHGDRGTIVFENVKLAGKTLTSIADAKMTCTGDVSGVTFTSGK